MPLHIILLSRVCFNMKKKPQNKTMPLLRYTTMSMLTILE